MSDDKKKHTPPVKALFLKYFKEDIEAYQNQMRLAERFKNADPPLKQAILRKVLSAYHQNSQHPYEVVKELMLLAMIDAMDEEMEKHRCDKCGNAKLVLHPNWSEFSCHC